MPTVIGAQRAGSRKAGGCPYNGRQQFNPIPSSAGGAMQAAEKSIVSEPRPGRLTGRVALIVGGGAGIGAASARLFAREGARIAVADLQADAARSVASQIVEQGGQAIGLPCDVTDERSVQAAVEHAHTHFGALHTLFNCAGGSLPEDDFAPRVDLSVWDRTVNLDGRGTFLCCRYAIPKIVSSGGGTVINMSSGAALRGSGKAHVYAATKGAIVSLTRALAGAYARDNVRVNAICAGRINTERVRATYGIPGRPGSAHDAMQVDEQIKTYPFWFGEPEDIANIALFLASDESRMITGASLPADGGRSAY
jgi:NAD(P)-dependent dehydrogenase (short-subunit alcohol dehydrogenase family)